MLLVASSTWSQPQLYQWNKPFNLIYITKFIYFFLFVWIAEHNNKLSLPNNFFFFQMWAFLNDFAWSGLKTIFGFFEYFFMYGADDLFFDGIDGAYDDGLELFNIWEFGVWEWDTGQIIYQVISWLNFFFSQNSLCEQIKLWNIECSIDDLVCTRKKWHKKWQ